MDIEDLSSYREAVEMRPECRLTGVELLRWFGMKWNDKRLKKELRVCVHFNPVLISRSVEKSSFYENHVSCDSCKPSPGCAVLPAEASMNAIKMRPQFRLAAAELLHWFGMKWNDKRLKKEPRVCVPIYVSRLAFGRKATVLFCRDVFLVIAAWRCITHAIEMRPGACRMTGVELLRWFVMKWNDKRLNY